ncbi:hypothetical protein EMIT0347P_50068 [Pseudomonas sp. IT-347P]
MRPFFYFWRGEKPLTLTLPKRRTAQRERGPTVVIVQGTPTWDFESNSGFERHEDRLPFPLAPHGGEGWGEGEKIPSRAQNSYSFQVLINSFLFLNEYKSPPYTRSGTDTTQESSPCATNQSAT